MWHRIINKHHRYTNKKIIKILESRERCRNAIKSTYVSYPESRIVRRRAFDRFNYIESYTICCVWSKMISFCDLSVRLNN
jgi:hypothetical protein